MTKKTNTELIAKEIEEKILNLEYKPGQIITECEISNKYNISRTPCRDIFQKLKSIGLIDSIPFKSNFISLLDFDIIKQSIFMRTTLEKEVIKNFVQIATPKDLIDLEYNLQLQNLLIKDQFNPEEFYKLDCEFHKIWFNTTNNLFIWEQIDKAQAQYKRFRMLDIVEVQNFEAIVEDHKLLISFIKNKDLVNIENHITSHLNSGIKRLQAKISSELSLYFK
ncbi:MAG: GntR family transcriptional regulator [Cetobacterium sp.]|uniref:GntR family transcriptional regulator n=1 Tax=Cetobacterium sp. TaxID=2071632 RepID=UPI002FC6FF78